MRKFWTWLDGRKTGIAVVVTIALGALEHYGAALPPWVQDATYALLGLGVAHKAVKAKIIAEQKAKEQKRLIQAEAAIKQQKHHLWLATVSSPM